MSGAQQRGSKVFGQRLQQARKLRKLSQGELADISHLQPTAISHYENASRRPSLSNLSKLATALHVTVDYLVGRNDYDIDTDPETVALIAKRNLIGWRESVSIPDWGVSNLVAKIDTGARTSSIHVTNLKHLSGKKIEFDVVLRRRKPVKYQSVCTTYLRMTKIRSSNGQIQERLVVSERIHIGHIDKQVELTLSVRDKMTCRMLLGRSALQEDFLINVDDKFMIKKQD
jgi:DNA-binding XRE family transcriptional regulator